VVQSFPDLRAELDAMRARLERLELSTRVPSVSTEGGDRRSIVRSGQRVVSYSTLTAGSSSDPQWERINEIELVPPSWATSCEVVCHAFGDVLLGSAVGGGNTAVLWVRVDILGGFSGIDPEQGIVWQTRLRGGASDIQAFVASNRRALTELEPVITCELWAAQIQTTTPSDPMVPRSTILPIVTYSA
jgi:hypothetical protein